MSDIWYLIGYIHIVGWLVACGQYRMDNRVTGKKGRIEHYLNLILIWPYFLGIK